MVEEIDLITGTVVNSLDYKKILMKGRKVNSQYSNFDWIHMNSVEKFEDDIIVSSNYQSAVVRNDWQGNIRCILSDPRGWTAQWKKYLLNPIGDNFEFPCNQHAAEVLPDQDNNSDTVDIVLFDNGWSRNEVNDTPDAVEYSRMVQYRINEKDMTVEQIWEYGSDYPELFANTRGQATILDNSNILGTFPRQTKITDDETYCDTVYLEITKDKKIVWECYASSKRLSNIYQEYRLERLPLYTESEKYPVLGTKVKVIEVK